MVQKQIVSSEKTNKDNGIHQDEPKLRFPEFNDIWNEVKLEDISELTSSKRIYLSDYVDNGIPFYRGAEITYLKKNKTIKTDLYISDEKYFQLKNKFGAPKKDDILITGVGTLGNVYRIPDNNPFYFKDGNLIWLKDISENANFIECYLDYKKNDILKLAIGSTQKALTIQSLGKLKIKIPSYKEQEKIASFLTEIDTKIELLEKTLNIFKNYSNHIISSYFDNINAEKIVKFDEIISKGKAGGTPKSSIKEYYDGDIPFLSINDMTSQGKYINFTEKKISEKGLTNSSAWIVPKNSLLYSIYASIGFVSINNIELCTSQAIYGIILKKEVNQDFIYYYLKNFKRFIHKYIETGTQGNLNSSIIKNLQIKLPPIEEQEYYSNFFKELDKKIFTKEKEIKQMKEFKKGVLQKMFV